MGGAGPPPPPLDPDPPQPPLKRSPATPFCPLPQSLLELCACLLNPFDQSGLAAIPTTYCSQKLQQNLVFCMENAATSLTRFAGEGLSGPSARAHWQDTGSVRVASTNTSNSQASSPGVPTAGHRKTYSSGTEGLL